MASITLQETTVARLWVEYSTSIDVSKNQSTTTLTLKLTTLNNYNIGPWGDFNGSYFGSTSNTFNGAIPNFSGTRNLASYKAVVNHSSDGKATLSVPWKWGVNSPWGGYVNPSGSFNITLPTIPRVTTPVLSDSDVNLGDKVTITLNRALTSHTHDIAIYYGSKSLMIAENVATSYQWTVPTSIGQWIPNTTSMDCKITVRTYQNGVLNGSASADIKINIPTTAKPTISSVKLSEANTNIGSFGLWIQGMSQIKVVTSASGIYGSTITNITATIEDVSYSGADFTTNTITKAGNLSIKVDVKDSRGRTATKTETITIQEYTAPQILKFDVRRCDDAGNIKENGTYARIEYQYKIASIGNKNARSMKLSYKDTDATTYTPIFATTEFYEENDVYFTQSLFALSDSYNVKIEVSDSFTPEPISAEALIATERVPLELLFTGLGVSIGKAAELDETLDIDLYTLFRKDVDFSGNINFANRVFANNGLTYKLNAITGGDDLNNYTTESGVYYVSGAVNNRPISGGGWLVVYANGASSIYQKYIALGGGSFERIKSTADTWGDWCGSFASDGWNYTKSLDGTLELTRAYTIPMTMNTNNSGVYETGFDIGIILPLAFTSAPLVTITASSADNKMILVRYIRYENTNAPMIYLRAGRLQGSSSSVSVTLQIRLLGKWK
jgi:hypothetical protein